MVYRYRGRADIRLRITYQKDNYSLILTIYRNIYNHGIIEKLHFKSLFIRYNLFKQLFWICSDHQVVFKFRSPL